MLKPVATDIEALKTLEERLRWLSAWTIHHANHIRESADGLKVGGHQASCASMTAIMAALYFHALGPNDRVAVKPHAGPVLHAIHYLLGTQTREALENFRGFGGAQSYPSRTKDRIPVDFSTGSVGLGVAITLFASLVQDYLTAPWLARRGGPRPLRRADRRCRARRRQYLRSADRGRTSTTSATCGGSSITTARASTRPAPTACSSASTRFSAAAAGAWSSCDTAKGSRPRSPKTRRQRPGSTPCPMPICRALHYQGGAAWRARIERDLGKKAARVPQGTMTTTRWRACSPTSAAIAWRLWSRRSTPPTTTSRPCSSPGRSRATACPSPATRTIIPGLMNPTQMAALRDAMGVREGQEWEPLEGVGDNARPGVEALIDRARIARDKRPRSVRHDRRSRISPRRPATSNRPRPRSAASCYDLSRGRRRARRPHRHHLARCHRLDQPRRLRQPARAVPPRANGRRLRRCKDCVRAKMVGEQQGPAYRARHRRKQSVPDARRRRASPATCSARGCSRSARSTTRSLPAASMPSITLATRTPASCWSRRRAASPSAPKAARTSRSTRR